jgi:hypothetical protein
VFLDAGGVRRSRLLFSMTAFRAWLPLLRPAALAALLAVVLLPPAPPRPASGDRSTDLRGALRDAGIEAREIAWVDAPRGLAAYLKSPRALVVGARGKQAPDVFLVETHQSPEGRVIRIENTFDLTGTSAAIERHLVVHDDHIAWTTGSETAVYRIELGDLGGQDIPRTEEWTRIARVQHALTNWQRTGRLRGVARRSFKLEPAAREVHLHIEGASLHVAADDRRVVIPFDPAAPIVGARYVVEQDRELARPGNLVTWAVDRARESAWFGNERMQVLKAVAFAALDLVGRAAGHLRPDDSAERIAEELGEPGIAPPPVHARVEPGWPPEPMRPVFRTSLPGEGHWRLLADDPFVQQNAGAPAPIATTFVRTDEDRVYSRIFVALWDPRQLDLHLMPGTEEPQTATGETGTGLIPRDAGTLSRLVAAFNGGFQSTHGDYGMMVDEHVLVPPRPYAATLALLRDGSTGFGTWPRDVSVSADLIAFRQNLTPLVQGGELNPYGRKWWGGVPQDWEDETRTVRSGICLTGEGFLAYFYGSQVDHEHLGRAMQSARCVYGMHLDMNQGHTGLEFYRVEPRGMLPPLSEKLDGIWRAEGTLKEPAYDYRARRLIKHMQLMHFPRYIRRSERDFFYLTLRHLLPGPRLVVAGAEGAEGTWTVDGLPQHGWPHAIATTQVRPDPGRPETTVRLLAIDPKFVTPTLGATSEDATSIVTFGAPAAALPLALWHDRRRFTLGPAAPSGSATRIASGVPEPPAEGVRAALGITETGMALHAEVATNTDPERDGALLSGLLHQAGCVTVLFFPVAPIVALGGAVDLGGHPIRPPAGSVELRRRTDPEVRRIFAETPVLPLREWSELQRQRRFFGPGPSTPNAPGP